MTMTTRQSVVCNCGHEGAIKCRENDTPYSGDFWEKYHLENLDGNSYNGINLSWDDILKRTNATCPKCKTKLNSSHLKK